MTEQPSGRKLKRALLILFVLAVGTIGWSVRHDYHVVRISNDRDGVMRVNRYTGSVAWCPIGYTCTPAQRREP